MAPYIEEEENSDEFEDSESNTKTGSPSIMDRTQVPADADTAGVTPKGSKDQANMARPIEKSSSKAKQATSKTANSQGKDGTSHDRPASSLPENAPHDNNPDHSTAPPPEPSTESKDSEPTPRTQEKTKKRRSGK